MSRVVSRTPPLAPFPPGPVRVLVVSDDPLVRAGLGHLLESESEAEVVTDATEAEVALWDGQHARLDEIGDLGVPAVAIVDDESHSAAALAAGARGAVLRSADGASLWAALVAVRHGLTVLDAALAPAATPAATAVALPRMRPGEELTAREREVLALLSRGLSNKQIASELAISEHTAKFHVNAILGKLGAASRTEAVVVAVRLGLVAL
jgi:two-component system, NarL family, nitrate/nitrite response regulator NarL